MLNNPPINYNPNPKVYTLSIKQKQGLFLLYFLGHWVEIYKLLLQDNNWLNIWIWTQLALANSQDDILSIFIMVFPLYID